MLEEAERTNKNAVEHAPLFAEKILQNMLNFVSKTYIFQLRVTRLDLAMHMRGNDAAWVKLNIIPSQGNDIRTYLPRSYTLLKVLHCEKKFPYQV